MYMITYELNKNTVRLDPGIENILQIFFLIDFISARPLRAETD